jgi:hypothetical protein
MNLLKALSADLITPEDKEELARLEARYPEVPLDLTLIERHRLLLAEPIRRIKLHRLREAEAEKRSELPAVASAQDSPHVRRD